MNKKIFLSLLLVLLVAVSVSAVSAEAVEDAVVTDAGVDNVLAADEPTVEPSADVTEIQQKIDNAKDGDTIELENKTYDVGATNFAVDKKITIKGNDATIKVDGAGQGGSGATFVAQVAGINFEGINFINTNGHKNYGEQVSGVAIQLAIENGTVDNCKFIDFSSGVYGRGASFCTITNSYFNGSAEKVTNGGTKEFGTKAINLMGSHDITVTGCTFEGQVLDGISIASNSGNNIMTDNTFIENCYAIYFGGASTQGCVIANNSFIRCGWCGDAEGKVIFKDLPVISTQKAANGYIIADNEIEATEGSIFMKAESGNTAHGYPSKIGDINITGNTIKAAEGASPESITFMYIFSNQGPLSPYAPIAITGNTLDAGITPVTVWYADWGDATGDVVIPATPKAPTFISVEKVATADKEIIVKLEDTNGEALGDKVITYTIAGGEEQSATTDADGLATISDLADGEIAISYAGDDQTEASSATVTFTSTATEKLATEIVASDMNTTAIVPGVDKGVGEYFKVTLKDSEGTLLANKAVQIGFNGKIYDKETDENGVAQLQINLGYKGDYTFAICFLGDEKYNGSFAVCKIHVDPQKATLTVPNKSYAASAKTKTLTATFKSAKGNLIANKKVTFTVKGKTYKATTNDKGVATVKVSLNKKGTYNFTVKYGGDSTISPISKNAKLVIK